MVGDIFGDSDSDPKIQVLILGQNHLSSAVQFMKDGPHSELRGVEEYIKVFDSIVASKDILLILMEPYANFQIQALRIYTKVKYLRKACIVESKQYGGLTWFQCCEAAMQAVGERRLSPRTVMLCSARRLTTMDAQEVAKNVRAKWRSNWPRLPKRRSTE